MASLKRSQPCGHAWAWHIEGACQRCRIEALQAILASIDSTPDPTVGGWLCKHCDAWWEVGGAWKDHREHHPSCIWRRAQEALKGQDHDTH